jgi:molecular chaperone Hsp33
MKKIKKLTPYIINILLVLSIFIITSIITKTSPFGPDTLGKSDAIVQFKPMLYDFIMGLKEPYSGSAELVTGEIAEDFTAYYAYSEQTPTAIALGVRIGKDLTCVGAGGVIIQALPGASEEALFMAEDVMSQLGSVSSLIETIGAEGIIDKHFGDIHYEKYEPEYKCLCSREYIEQVLISLGKAELYDIVEKEGEIKVD